jgi:hypothetical protein
MHLGEEPSFGGMAPEPFLPRQKPVAAVVPLTPELVAPSTGFQVAPLATHNQAVGPSPTAGAASVHGSVTSHASSGSSLRSRLRLLPPPALRAASASPAASPAAVDGAAVMAAEASLRPAQPDATAATKPAVVAGSPEPARSRGSSAGSSCGSWQPQISAAAGLRRRGTAAARHGAASSPMHGSPSDEAGHSAVRPAGAARADLSPSSRAVASAAGPAASPAQLVSRGQQTPPSILRASQCSAGSGSDRHALSAALLAERPCAPPRRPHLDKPNPRPQPPCLESDGEEAEGAVPSERGLSGSDAEALEYSTGDEADLLEAALA